MEQNMHKNYQNHWMMKDTENNGDITKIDNILDIEKRLKNKIHLYTSDFGLPYDNDNDKKEIPDTNYQETQTILGNVGQILTGLLILKDKGHLIVKIYTFFKQETIFIFGLLSNIFDELYITKPISSRQRNDERYIYGKGFKLLFDLIYSSTELFKIKDYGLFK